jgi:hypothetical protein
VTKRSFERLPRTRSISCWARKAVRRVTLEPLRPRGDKIRIIIGNVGS